MLFQMCCTSTRISQCRSILSNRLLTHTRFRMMSSLPPLPSNAPQKPPIRTAYVRTWEPPKNIADTYAILRVLERKYGKILEARFLKDYEDPIRYQMVFWVMFEDPESVQRIPTNGGEFVYNPPKVSGERHEISMEDLETLAQSEDFQEESDVPTENPDKNQDSKDTSVSGGRIVRAENDLIVPGAHLQTIHQMTPKPVMAAFLRWGGFQPLDPLPKQRTIEEYELFGKTDLDNVRMRASLQLSSSLLGVPNPSIRTAAEQAQLSNDKPLLSSLVFGDGDASQSTSSPNVEATTSTSQKSTAKAQSQPPPPLATPSAAPKSAPKTRKSKFIPEPEDYSAPLPQEKDAATIVAELKAQETLKRQLEFARQLKEQASATRRKQPKPQVKMAKEKPPAFFEGDAHLPEFEERKTGVMTRLWGMFGRK